MPGFNLNLSRQTPAQLVAMAELAASQLAPAAPATPPLPNMSAKVTSMSTASTTADTSDTAYEEAKAALVNLKQVRDDDADALRVEIKATAAAAEAEAKGDAALLAATGFPLAAENTQSTQPPGQVTNFSITAGDHDGELDGQHDPAARAKSYEVQSTTGDAVTGPYATVLQPTASRWNLGGLTSGQRVWLRVRGIGSNGPGPWSDPATKIVP